MTDDITDEKIAHLTTLEQAIKPAPWKFVIHEDETGEREAWPDCDFSDEDVQAFIVEFRNAAPGLLAALKEARERLDTIAGPESWKAECNRLQRQDARLRAELERVTMQRDRNGVWLEGQTFLSPEEISSKLTELERCRRDLRGMRIDRDQFADEVERLRAEPERAKAEVLAYDKAEQLRCAAYAKSNARLMLERDILKSKLATAREALEKTLRDDPMGACSCIPRCQPADPQCVFCTARAALAAIEGEG